jgi:TetR/AcrR family transcriptional repressor of mexJK operon
MCSKMPILKRRSGVAAGAEAELGEPVGTPSEPARLLHLIQAAERTFLEKGYHTATMNDVAKAAGMSKKTVYKLIDSKAGLLIALLDHYAGKLATLAIDPSWTLNEALVQVLLGIGQFILAPKQVSMIRLIMAEYVHSNDFGEIFHQRRMKKAQSILERCVSRIGPPKYTKPTKLGEMTAMLYGMALGEFQVTSLVGHRAVPTKAAMTRRIRCAVDLFLAGCEKD